MLNIAICDDNEILCSQLEQLILKYDKNSEEDLNVDIFYDGVELLRFIKNDHPFDLIFLDIELLTTTGIEVGKTIRNELDDHISKIVFISSKNGYEQELFDVQPINFLKKPITLESVTKCINLVLKLLNRENNVFEYQYNSELKKVPLKDILYFESCLKKIKIVTFVDEDYFYGSLEKLSSRLPKTFIAPHGSFLVNYNNIDKITKQDVYMLNGKTIPISRRYLKNIQNFHIEMAREIKNVNL